MREQNTNTLVTDIIRYMLSGDMDRFEKHLASLLLTVSSYYDGVVKKHPLYLPEVAEDQKFEDFYYGFRKVIVLLDEYDTPLHYAKLAGYYDEMLNITRALMVDGMKGNANIEKGIVTGIMKISQESIFSAFNNPKVATLAEGWCADMFGFTESEVMEMLEYYSLSEQADTVREWYNGYLFGGDTVIYNPWSIINYLDDQDHRARTYWVNTGDTELIKSCMRLDEAESKRIVRTLLEGEEIEARVEQNIVYEDVFADVKKTLSYLLHLRYLKAKSGSGEGTV